MSENEKNVPRRRFREFQNAKGWEQRKLGEALSLLKDGTHGTHNDVDNGVYLLSAKNIKNGIITIDAETDRMISEEEYKKIHKNFQLKKGDVLLTIVGSIGESAIIETPGNITFQRSVAYLRPNDKITSNFLLATINTSKFKLVLKNRQVVSAQPGIYLGVLEAIPFQYPTKVEQEKIGTFFRNLDNLITLHQRKLEKMKALKKAYLTEMFPAEGERKPKRRFDAFGDDWEQRKVKDICSISTGKSNTQDKIEDGEYPFYVRSPIIERSNRYLYDEEAVLTVGDGVGTGKVFHYVNGKYDLHQRVYRMFDFCNGVSVKYFYYYFSKYFYDRVMAMTAKTSVDSVRYEMIAEMDIEYPSEQEQNQIVIALEQLDNLITIHQYKLEKLQNIKKAYLNEMFI
ncbi:restriction endonuclease subunit S [Clostridium sporogenes]|uniref:restriction endonuclease subunit S n=1 Tax=Clostridium sporogenes TaxID=1509 RepID=UPI002238A195|nr:restriction endonuclease subunit S [Clostridium sporogenes]MCW6075114.1 restriction endonuclease subunit S [Clostridium sporogenes]